MGATNKRLNQFCNDINTDFEKLNASTRKRLEQAASVFDSIENEYQDAKKVLTPESMSIAALSKTLGLSRAAIYKNSVLRLFIDRQTKALKKEYFSVSETEEIAALKKRIELLEKRDEAVVLLRKKVNELEDDLAHAHDATEQNLLVKYRKLQEENKALTEENLELYRMLNISSPDNNYS